MNGGFAPDSMCFFKSCSVWIWLDWCAAVWGIKSAIFGMRGMRGNANEMSPPVYVGTAGNPPNLRANDIIGCG